jgi:hypothetical protein
MRFSRREKGIIIITTLAITVFIIMFATATMFTMSMQQNSAAGFYRQKAAFAAAEAGINYALMRIETNPAWNGCMPNNDGNKGEFFSVNQQETGLIIYERPVEGLQGYVEGQVRIGEHDGYFELYFIKPKSSKEAMFAQPDNTGKMLLSVNNTSLPGVNANSSVQAYYVDGRDAEKVVPANSILLVSRGRVGREISIIETCVRIIPDKNYNAVAVGRGDIRIRVHGVDPGDNLKLRTGLDGISGKPSIMRSNANIFILGLNERPGFDFLRVDKGSGGRMEGNAFFGLFPRENYSKVDYQNQPQQGSSFIQEKGQDTHLPALTIADFKLPPAVKSISAGTYIFDSNPSNPSVPRVTYYEKDDRNQVLKSTESIQELYGSGQNKTDVFQSLISGGYINWDNNSKSLSILSPLEVSSVSGGNTDLNSIVFKTNDRERLTVYVGAPDAGESAMLLNNNDNGSIYVDGELSGTGTIVSRGELFAEAGSSISADENGVSIYSVGNTTIQQIKKYPADSTSTTISQTTEPLNMINSRMENWMTDAGTLSALSPTQQTPATSSPDSSILFVDGKAYSYVVTGTGTYEYSPNMTYDINKQSNKNETIDAENPTQNVSQSNIITGGSVINISGQVKETNYYALPLDAFSAEEQALLKNLKDEMGQPLLGELSYSKDGKVYTVPALKWKMKPDGSNPADSEYHLHNNVMRVFDKAVDQSAKQIGLGFKMKSTDFRGLVFSCRDFIAKTPNYGFRLRGGLAAYGGNPETGTTDKYGRIHIDAINADFMYDTRYLNTLLSLGNKSFEKLYWVVSDSWMNVGNSVSDNPKDVSVNTDYTQDPNNLIKPSKPSVTIKTDKTNALKDGKPLNK